MTENSEEVEDLSPAEELSELLETLVEAFALRASVRIEASAEELVGTIEGEDAGLLIGRQGNTIEAIQHLAQRIVLRGGGGPRVVVDAAGYRSERKATLKRQADDALRAAISSGAPVALDPMSAAERRFVHEYLRERGDAETHSEGQEPARHLIVTHASS